MGLMMALTIPKRKAATRAAKKPSTWIIVWKEIRDDQNRHHIND